MIGSVPVYCGAFKQGVARKGLLSIGFFNFKQTKVRLPTFVLGDQFKKM